VNRLIIFLNGELISIQRGGFLSQLPVGARIPQGHNLNSAEMEPTYVGCYGEIKNKKPALVSKSGLMRIG
jgi:hypothetical protein